MDGIFVKSRYKIRRKIYMIVIIQEEKGEGPKRVYGHLTMILCIRQKSKKKNQGRLKGDSCII